MLQRNGIDAADFETKALEGETLEEDTLILTMTDAMKQKVLHEYADIENVYTFCEFVGRTEEIPNVYGQDQETYEAMYVCVQTF